MQIRNLTVKRSSMTFGECVARAVNRISPAKQSVAGKTVGGLKRVITKT